MRRLLTISMTLHRISQLAITATIATTRTMVSEVMAALHQKRSLVSSKRMLIHQPCLHALPHHDALVHPPMLAWMPSIESHHTLTLPSKLHVHLTVLQPHSKMCNLSLSISKSATFTLRSPICELNFPSHSNTSMMLSAVQTVRGNSWSLLVCCKMPLGCVVVKSVYVYSLHLVLMQGLSQRLDAALKSHTGMAADDLTGAIQRMHQHSHLHHCTTVKCQILPLGLAIHIVALILITCRHHPTQPQ